ncbi:MAG: ATP-binding protein [Deltaproteobacteria bacterium]|nr:ATP-binding protein [Deltaproteobacteria bacterium]
MIDFSEFSSIQERLLRHTPSGVQRALHRSIDWGERLIGLSGARGTGKTTLLLQHLGRPEAGGLKSLYLSADHVRVEAIGLYDIGSEFFQMGGELLVIDEIHKQVKWTQTLKSLYDAFPAAQIIFSGSSPLHLHVGKVDLSRRVVYYTLPTLSFREYLAFTTGHEHEPCALDELLENHVAVARDVLRRGPVLGHFRDFLHHGAYPFFLEGVASYHDRLRNVIEKTLYEDIAGTSSIQSGGIPVLKKILWQVASAQPFQLNIERLASNLGISRPTLYTYLGHLERARLLTSVMPQAPGSARARKPEKLFLENTNLLRAVGEPITLEDPRGNIRETFFARQARNAGLPVTAAKSGDFVIDSRLFEIGGKRKSFKQVAGRADAYVVRDDIEVGMHRVIPLWLFGFLY